MAKAQNTPRRFDPVSARTLMTEAQAAIVQSAITLVIPRTTQADWARRNGIDPAALSKMLNGHWAVTEKYAEAMNRLVAEMHPVDVPRTLALAA